MNVLGLGSDRLGDNDVWIAYLGTSPGSVSFQLDRTPIKASLKSKKITIRLTLKAHNTSLVSM